MSGNATQHQKYQPFPKLDSAIADPNGQISIPWYRLLITLWNRAGGAVPANLLSATAYVSLVGTLIDVFRNSDGAKLGTVQLDVSTGGVAVAQTVGASPWTFTAPKCGTLVVDSGQVELARGLGSFWTVGLAGGAIPVMAADRVRITYYRTTPTVAFLPCASG